MDYTMLNGRILEVLGMKFDGMLNTLVVWSELLEF